MQKKWNKMGKTPDYTLQLNFRQLVTSIFTSDSVHLSNTRCKLMLYVLRKCAKDFEDLGKQCVPIHLVTQIWQPWSWHKSYEQVISSPLAKKVNELNM